MNKLFTRIEHVAIAARDPEALAAWYVANLGFNIRITFDNGPGKPKTYMIAMENREPYIEIIPADLSQTVREKANTDPGISHLAICVSDFDAALKSLVSAGARREGDERKAPYGARVQFFRDLEGNLFHLLFRPTGLPEA
jgi:catechol 2,3-dioxygenase-like lactoylglutathione lyase family enzyme